MRGMSGLGFCMAVVFAAVHVMGRPTPADDSATVKKLFADPPRQFASAPLWVWNDMLTEEQVRGTLRDLAGQKVKQAFVHPRPGLMTPYLSDEWFRLWKAALDEAEKLDMNLWIYDENSYPSGFAGGWVPELMPQSRGRGLVFRTQAKPGKPGPEVLGVYRLTEKRAEQVTSQAREGTLPEGQYLVASVVRARNSPWHGGRCYVDLMYPGVTEKFLEVTLEPYRKHLGAQFGKRVPGSFTDEPNIRPAGGLPWTDDLPQVFQKRWGYSLLDALPSLARPVGDWKKVRHDYYAVLLQLFIERWARPYYDWCEKNGIAFTGHYWDHEWPNCGGVPDNMALSAWQHIPGIDCLMNQYREDTHAQFGNVRMVKEVASLANQLGRKRVLCEVYGAGGWDLRFEDMKRIGDWLEVLGINLLDEHLSYVTIRGARKADHPQSFSYHEPWWEAYHVVAGYFSRVTAALAHGQQVNRIVVLEPTTTAWMYQGAAEPADRLGRIGKEFFDFLMDLERAQVEYDLGCEDVIGRFGTTRQLWSPGAASKPGPADLAIGNRRYDLLILPPGTESLEAATVRWMEPYVWRGGRVLCCGPAPKMVDGRPSDRLQKLAQSPGWKECSPAEAVRLAAELSASFGMKFVRAAGDSGILFHHRRQLRDGELVFLVNTSIEHPSRGHIEAAVKGVELWCCHTGKVLPYTFQRQGGQVRAPFELPPCGSLLLFFSHQDRPPASPASEVKEDSVAPAGPMQVRRLEPNVLTLDYLDVSAGGESHQGLHFYHANQFAFRKNGLERNPWDSAVQFKDEIIRTTFPATSGFEATYRFTIEKEVPRPLWIVVERPDLYSISCNGQPVSPSGQWWLDRAFGRLDISRLARVGENTVTLRARPFTIYHETEPAYLLGDFSLRPTDKGFVVVPPAPLALADEGWNQQGHPFYGAGVAYAQTFAVPSPSGRYVVAVPRWYGSVAKVLVNGKPVGYIGWQPWECDVTEAIRPGNNTIEVIVVGTLKNTLGPHHAGPVVGSAWPGMFHQGPRNGPPPGKAYHTISYGLFAPFQLKHIR